MKTLLAIDNSRGVLDRVFKLIEKIPGVEPIYTLTIAEEITESLRSLRPDVLVMDLYLLDGTVMDVMNDLAFSSNKPVLIILTEQPYEDIEAQLKIAGADYVLNKSLEFELIVKILNQLSEEERGNQIAY